MTYQRIPVFIHSLFRSGSTYLFNCFRQSKHGYWCYQEPLNEFLLNAVSAPDKLLELHEDNALHLRHPKLDKPYFFEFYPLAAQIGRTFRQEFSYQDYFSTTASSAEALCNYLNILVEGAQNHPVFQECRSCGRIDVIRQCIGGRHIFLWRNPWDQWWSYKVDSHFEICNLQILASPSTPSVFVELRKLLGFSTIDSDAVNLAAQRLGAADSYMLFFALWCHAMLEGRKACDLEINIDSLSESAEYRSLIEQQLRSHGIDDLDFSDCAIPISIYGPDDRSFFDPLEDQIIELFLQHGYIKEDIDAMLNARKAHDIHDLERRPIDLLIAKGYDRARRIARRLETELAGSQHAMGEQQRLATNLSVERQQLQAALTAREEERQQLQAALTAREEERQQLQAALIAREEERQQLQAALIAREEERQQLQAAFAANEQALSRLLNSLSWRASAPLRVLEKLILRFIIKFYGEHK